MGRAKGEVAGRSLPKIHRKQHLQLAASRSGASRVSS